MEQRSEDDAIADACEAESATKKPGLIRGVDLPVYLPDHLKWKGLGPMPAKWKADDGTIVYRSYGDYCND